MPVTHESRGALARARFFLDKAKACAPDDCVDFEAFLEASIVFARAAVHRLKTKYERNPRWQDVWGAWLNQPAIQFFRDERDLILKEAPPKLSQKLFAGFFDSSGSSTPAFIPSSASAFYYFDNPDTPATVTVAVHLASLATLLAEAEQAFKP